MGSFLQHAPFKLLQENKKELNQEMFKTEKVKKKKKLKNLKMMMENTHYTTAGILARKSFYNGGVQTTK